MSRRRGNRQRLNCGGYGEGGREGGREGGGEWMHKSNAEAGRGDEGKGRERGGEEGRQDDVPSRSPRPPRASV